MTRPKGGLSDRLDDSEEGLGGEKGKRSTTALDLESGVRRNDWTWGRGPTRVGRDTEICCRDALSESFKIEVGARKREDGHLERWSNRIIRRVTGFDLTTIDRGRVYIR